jgi:hypothetical protein
MVTQIQGITPTTLSRNLFRESLDEEELRFWAEDNSTACFRRFSVGEMFGYEVPIVSNNDVEWKETMCDVVVSYPKTWALYGANNRRSLDKIIEQDLVSIDDVIGARGMANYSEGHAVISSHEIEEGEKVVFLVSSFDVRFYRSV